jgi:hypothetical protein
MIEILAAIDAPKTGSKPGFFAGIVLWDDRVEVTADIVRYMRGWDRDRVRSYCKQRGWTVTIVRTRAGQRR